jgi:quercetin dioxygenase-like cupin family protein
LRGGGEMDKMDPMKAAANVSKHIMENDRVRVLEATFKPGDVAKTHHHPDHVMYVLKGGKLKMSSEGKTNEMDLTAGQAVFLKAQDHEVENIGKTTVDIIVVELKK